MSLAALLPRRALPALIPLLALAIGIAFGSARAEDATGPAERLVTIGTGGITGVYFPAGGAICRLVNARRAENGLRCAVESTAGSIFNLEALRSGALDIALAQSDWQFHAWKGSARFEDEPPLEGLRSLFSLHAEPFTVLARADSDIRRFADLKGRRVNAGAPGSGQRATFDVLVEALGWTQTDFAGLGELGPAEQTRALCGGQTDAIVYAVGHPNGAIQKAALTCDIVLVAVDGPEVERLIEERPYYAAVEIPGGLYRGIADPVPTFGVLATVVTTLDLPDDVAYEVTRLVFENLEALKRMHPAFAGLDAERMAQAGLSAPRHPGAARFLEKGDGGAEGTGGGTSAGQGAAVQGSAAPATAAPAAPNAGTAARDEE